MSDNECHKIEIAILIFLLFDLDDKLFFDLDVPDNIDPLHGWVDP